MRRRLPLPLVAFTLAFAACAAPAGHLIIIGGGLQPDNARILQRFVELAGARGPITIIATASADPSAALADSLAQLGRYVPRNALAGLFDSASRPPASSRESTAQLRRSGGLFFTGGDQGRITARFRPGGSDSAERAAMRALLAGGGVIAGTSAGAAMMSDPMFTGGDSETALAAAAAACGPPLGRGMGLFPYGLIDSHFFSRGRLGRLIAALAAGIGRYGLGVADNRGVEVDLRHGRLIALGDRAALLVDAGGLRRAGRSLEGARITLLSDGDELDLRTGAVRPAGGRVLETARRAALPADTLPSAWDRDVLLERLESLAQSGRAAAAASPAFIVRLSADEKTGFVFGADGRLSTAVGVIVDIAPRPASPIAR